MRIAVTGSAGRVGKVVCRALVEAGHEVVGLDMVLAKDLPGVSQRVVDLLNRSEVFTAMAGAEVLLHLGNHPNVHRARPVSRVYTENTTMNSNVFEAAVAVGCQKIVFASSIQAFGSRRTLHDDPMPPAHAPYLPLDAQSPSAPTNMYGLSKVAGEQLLEMHTRASPGLAGVSVRLPWVGGRPGQRLGCSLADARAVWGGRGYSAVEAFAYLPGADAARLFLVLLERMAPGYDCVFPSSEDNQFGIDAEALARDYFAGVEIRSDLAGRRSLVDNSAITERYGWAPTPLALPEPEQAK